MVKANELRKGNLFLYKGNITEVVGIDQNDNIIIDNNYYDEGIEHVKEDDGDPIPLTSEWLERCGFEKISEYHPEGPIYRGGIQIQLDVCYGYKFVDIHAAGSLNSLRVQLQYLHQLQNLFFALTGEELNVKL